MGGIQSKSPLERRNTVLRRSQRKSVFGLKGKLELLQKDIRRFKGVEEDEKFDKLSERLVALKKELRRQGRDLQKEVKPSYDGVKEKILETEKLLQNKLAENIEAQQNKDSKKKKSGDKVTSNVDEDEDRDDLESHAEGSIIASQVGSLVTSTVGRTVDPRRKSVEIKSVRVITHEPTPNVQSPTPSEKRKSILKMGVAVMPQAILNHVTNRQPTTSVCSNEEYEVVKQTNQTEQLEYIVDKLRKIEFSINTFSGLKTGPDYQRIKEELGICKTDLDAMDVSKQHFEKWNEANQYCKSCDNFLEEKARENAEPKMPKHNSLKQYKSNEELNEAYSKLTKSTDV